MSRLKNKFDDINKKPTTMTQHQFADWLSHRERLKNVTAVTNNRPAHIDPRVYLKATGLREDTMDLRHILAENVKLLQRINRINKTGGYIDCWNFPTCEDQSVTKARFRHGEYKKIAKENKEIYKRVTNPILKTWTAKEYMEQWKKTESFIKSICRFPFILGKITPVNKFMYDPTLEAPIGIKRPRVRMEFNVKNGGKLMKATIELFSDICPVICGLFLKLTRGTSTGHGYTGTTVYRVVSDLYFRGGDVVSNDGFGDYSTIGKRLVADNFTLKHSVPGIISLLVNDRNELTGQFNIIFKPMPQFNGQHAVFGRIIHGNTVHMDRINDQAKPLGRTRGEIIVERCSYINH